MQKKLLYKKKVKDFKKLKNTDVKVSESKGNGSFIKELSTNLFVLFKAKRMICR